MPHSFKQTVINRAKSFGYAFEGILAFLKSEPNARIHLLAIAVVCTAGIYFHVSNIEWCLLTIAIVSVVTTEMLNTAIEKWMDAAHPERSPVVKFIKDVAAAAVLITAIGAIIIAGMIFLPKIG